MNFYLNEVGLLQSWPDHIKEEIVEIKEIYELLDYQGSKLLIKEAFFYEECFQNLCQNSNEFYPFLALLSQLEQIRGSEEAKKILLTSNPDVSNSKAIELFQLCIKNNQKEIISSGNDQEIVKELYVITCGLGQFDIKNMMGVNQLAYHLKHNPPCTSILEVFERAERLSQYLRFTKKAMSTAKKHSFYYKSYGYDQMLDLLLYVDELLYPYLSGKAGSTEDEMIEKFKRVTGVEFSQEDKETLKMFGYQRDADVNGVTYRFSYHLKPEDNIRIYFDYFPEEGVIYIGPAGGHLKIVSRKN